MKINTIITTILIVFTILQLVILFTFGYTPYPDSNSYINLAKECIQEKTFYPTPIQYQTNDFIWNIGAIDLTTISLMTFGSITPLMVIYSILKGITAFLVFLTAKIITENKTTAFIALIIYVLYPANYGESTSVLSEIPFMFFTMLGVTASLKNKPVSGGFSIAIANWFRPMGIVFISSLLLFFFIKSRRKAISKSLKLLAGYTTFIIIVGSVNYVRTGDFIFQARNGWWMLMTYSWEKDKNKNPDKPLFEGQNPLYTNKKEYNCQQKDSMARNNFFKWLSQNKLEYISQMPEKLIRTYVSDNVNMCTFIPDKRKLEYMYGKIDMASIKNDFPYYSPIQVLTIINLIFYYVLIIMFIKATIFIIKNKNPERIILQASIIILGTLMLLIVGHGESRYHIPFMPFIIMTVAFYISNKRNGIISNHATDNASK